jgi:hypothetical protein
MDMKQRQTFARRGAILIIVFVLAIVTYEYGARAFKRIREPVALEQTTDWKHEQTTYGTNTSIITKGILKTHMVASKTSSVLTQTGQTNWFLFADTMSTSSISNILTTIARCESGGDPQAKNPTSSAKGLLQIIDSTWENFQCNGDPLNGEDNLRCGRKILINSGIHHWNPSRACWSKLVDNQLSHM